MRQHTTPILLSKDGQKTSAAMQLGHGPHGHALNEATIQSLIQQYPLTLPISEIDPLFVNPVPICMELNTAAGPIDNFMVTASGLPVLVECKLWRNPESRRDVIGQILDYAKELTHMSASDIQREVSKRLSHKGNAIIDLLRSAGHEIEETEFIDSLSFNLRRGRFLLLIVGDGIREGVESIVDYVQMHSGLHFTLGLVELPIYELSGGDRLVVPRVVARTVNIVRTVVEMPDGYTIADAEAGIDDEIDEKAETPERRAGRERINAVRKAFWTDFLNNLELDEPEQLKPSPALGGHVVFKFGAPGGSSWLTVYRDMRANSVGLFLSGNVGSIGERAARGLASEISEIKEELGPEATVDFSETDYEISQRLSVNDLENSEDRETAIAWLCERTNAFINALRPRIRANLRELSDE